MYTTYTLRRLLIVCVMLFATCGAAPAQAADDWVLAEVGAHSCHGRRPDRRAVI